MQKIRTKKKLQPEVTQKTQPGLEFKMDPKPGFTGQVMHPNGGEIVNG